MAAYAIARLNFPGKALILTAALAIAMFPPISIVGPLFNIWREVGLYDTWPGLIIPYLTFSLPLAIYTLSAFFREIPWELEQAAQVDGATPFQAFRKVIVPLAAPGVFTTAILVFIFAWNDFLFAISLTSTNAARTVPAALSAFPGASQFTAADRVDRRRGRDRDDPDHHHGSDLPTPHRRGAHRRRSQGLRRLRDGRDRTRGHHQAVPGRLRGRQAHGPRRSPTASSSSSSARRAAGSRRRCG